MRSSYKKEDVTLLLKDITGMIEPLPTSEREKLIQSGVHYCEMLPLEYKLTEEYMSIYRELLSLNAEVNAKSVALLSKKIFEAKGNNLVLVSLARAGIPVGILVKHYIKFKYNVDVPHYSISIIRGRGIDDNAMKYILDKHDAKDLIFVDGWTGKGAIQRQLTEALRDYDNVSDDLAVLADPAHVAKYSGTTSDILIPSCCLNSTVSGLISRTFLRDDIIGKNDFHGAVYYEELKDYDLSYNFIDTVESYFSLEVDDFNDKKYLNPNPLGEVKQIGLSRGISDINLVKPSIGETTRVLLRRVPYTVIINYDNREDSDLKPIIQLAKEKNVNIEYVPLMYYKACGVIKELADA